MKVDLFLIGLATIPFDNLPFAPSSGWATISPIIFFAYCFFNLRLLMKAMTRNYYISFVYMSGAMAYQFFLVTIYGIHVASFFDGVRSLLLGITFYSAFIIRYEICRADINRDAKVLYKAYILSFIYGAIWLITQKYFPSSISIFKLMERRYYARLAFTFTEPSFISMHTIGVMFLFSYFLHDLKLAVKFIRLGFAFMIFSILNASSARCAVDFIMLMLLVFMRNLLPPPARVKILINQTVKSLNRNSENFLLMLQ